MPLPIAELYAEPRSPFLLRSLAPTARSLSRASQVTPITTRTSTGRRVSKSTFRTSVSFKPTDDPFAAFTPVEESFDADWHLVQAEDARESHSSSEGHPVSSEGMASGRRAGTLPNRRASFLRSLWAPFSSSSSSSLPKKPHRSRSAAELSISRPMEHTPTPSIAPRNPVAPLVSIGEAEEAATATQSSSYPSGTNSLRQPPTAVSKRASLSNFFFLKRGSEKSCEPAEPSELGEIGLALTTDEVASASGVAIAPQQQDHMPARASLSASLPVRRLRGSASWSVTGSAGRSRAASVATDAHHPPRPRTANSCVTSTAYAVPTLSKKTTRGHGGKVAGFRRLSIFGLMPSFAPGTPPFTPRRPSSAAAAGRLRSDSRTSLRSMRSHGPAPPQPLHSVARSPSRSRLRPDSDTSTPVPSINGAGCTVGACDCLTAPLSSARLRKQSSSISVASEPVRRSSEWQNSFSSFRQQELSADEHSRRSSDEESARLLASIEFERRRLVAERERLATELGAIIRGAEDRCNRLYESSLSRVGSTSSLSMQERPAGTRSPSSRQFDLRESIIEEDDDDEEEEGALQNADVLPEQDPAQAMLIACQEALEALSVRLALALRATDDGRNPDLLQDSCDVSLATTPSRQSARSSDCTLVASAISRRTDASDTLPASKTRPPLSPFQPKALMLTPPATPDEGHISPASSSSVSQAHTRSKSAGSFGGQSVLSCRARGSPVSSPATLRPAHRRTPSSAFSTASCRTWSAAGSDDGSFVSCGEGSARSSSPASRAETPVPNLLTLASADFGTDRASQVNPHSSPQLGHGRQSSWSINAPAVPLFTRAKSPRCPA